MRGIRDSWYSKWKNMYGILFLRLSRYKICLRTDVTLKPCRVMLLKSVLSRNCYHNNSCGRPACFQTGLYACFIRNYHSETGVYGFHPHKKNTWEGKQITKWFSQICMVYNILLSNNSVESIIDIMLSLFLMHKFFIAGLLPVMWVGMASCCQRRQEITNIWKSSDKGIVQN